MEIIFLLISLIISVATTYGMGRLMFSHRELINLWKMDELVFVFHILGILMFTIVLFTTLCAINNTFWHIPYYFL